MRANSVLRFFAKIAPEAIGEEAAKQIKPLYFKNGILTVACLSSLAMQEAQYREQEIVDKINKELEGEVVRKLNYEN